MTTCPGCNKVVTDNICKDCEILFDVCFCDTYPVYKKEHKLQYDVYNRNNEDRILEYSHTVYIDYSCRYIYDYYIDEKVYDDNNSDNVIANKCSELCCPLCKKITTII